MRHLGDRHVPLPCGDKTVIQVVAGMERRPGCGSIVTLVNFGWPALERYAERRKSTLVRKTLPLP